MRSPEGTVRENRQRLLQMFRAVRDVKVITQIGRVVMVKVFVTITGSQDIWSEIVHTGGTGVLPDPILTSKPSLSTLSSPLQSPPPPRITPPHPAPATAPPPPNHSLPSLLLSLFFPFHPPPSAALTPAPSRRRPTKPAATNPQRYHPDQPLPLSLCQPLPPPRTIAAPPSHRHETPSAAVSTTRTTTLSLCSTSYCTNQVPLNTDSFPIQLRGKHILVTKKAIEEILNLQPKSNQPDGYQKAEDDMRFVRFDWDTVKRTIALYPTVP
nr:pollen-specific leucine-rich repeat extensin-like protein 1 [Arachis hypogaea]